MNQVLLVGVATARLELDLLPYGMSCHTVNDAKGAVDELKSALSRHQPWSSVVVSAFLPDMTGPAFVDGLMRHFDPDTVVLVADVEPHIAQHLSSSPKVHIFSAATDGVVIADHLFKRIGQKAGPPPPGFSSGGGMGAPPAPSVPPPGSAAAGLASLFEPPRTAAGGTAQQTPQQPFSMPPPTQSGWGPPGSARPQSTMPFFQALQSQPPQTQAPSTLAHAAPPQQPQQVPSSPPQPLGPDKATLARIEAMADELAGAQAEIVTLKARLQASETRSKDTTQKLFERDSENAALANDVRSLKTELDMVRQAGVSDVAANEGLQQQLDATRIELDATRLELHGAMTDRDGAMGQLELVRAERDNVVNAADQLRRQLSVMKADLEQQRAMGESLEASSRASEQGLVELRAAHALLQERDAAIGAAHGQLQGQIQELTQAHQAALAAHTATMAAKEELEQRLVEVRQQMNAELEAARTALDESGGLKAEIDVLRQAKRESETAWSHEQQRAAGLEAALAEAQAGLTDLGARNAQQASEQAALRESEQLALGDLLTAQRDGDALRAQVGLLEQQLANAKGAAALVDELRVQLGEAERYGKLEEARAERAVQDAAAMRRMIEMQTHEQARIVGEIEQLRPIATEVERSRAALVDMQRQLEAALGTDDADGSTEGAIEEGVRARTRELLELARAIEPFSWGLDQAATFFADAQLEGSQRHVQSMRLLQKTLERLKNELDRLHT